MFCNLLNGRHCDANANFVWIRALPCALSIKYNNLVKATVATELACSFQSSAQRCVRSVVIIVAAVVGRYCLLFDYSISFSIHCEFSQKRNDARCAMRCGVMIIIIKCEQRLLYSGHTASRGILSAFFFSLFIFCLHEITFYFCLSLWHVESKCCRCRRRRRCRRHRIEISVSYFEYIIYIYTICVTPPFPMLHSLSVCALCIAAIRLCMEMEIDSTL